MSLYLMTHPDPDPEAKPGSVKERLVEANNIHTARNFVARGIIGGGIAKSADLFRLAKAGVDVEVATGAPEVQAEVDAAQDGGEGKPEGDGAEAGGESGSGAGTGEGGGEGEESKPEAEAPAPEKPKRK